MAFPNTPIIDTFFDPSPPHTLDVLEPLAWGKSTSIDAVCPSTTSGGALQGTSGAAAARLDVTGIDLEAYVTMVTLGSGANACALHVRTQNLGGTTYRLYRMDVEADGGWSLGNDQNATAYGFGNAGSLVCAAGDSYGLQIVGYRLNCFQKAAAGSWTLFNTAVDGSKWTSGVGGIGIELTSTVSPGVATNFGGGGIPVLTQLSGPAPLLGIR